MRRVREGQQQRQLCAIEECDCHEPLTELTLPSSSYALRDRPALELALAASDL